MTYPMKIRAVVKGDVADIKVLIEHPMDTGQAKDPKGNIIPEHFIQNVTATYNGKTVLDAQWSQAISRNPFLGFRVRGAKAGDKVIVSWMDNKANKGSIDAVVQAG